MRTTTVLVAALLTAGCVADIGSAPRPGLVDGSAALPASQGYTTDVLMADLDGNGTLDLLWADQVTEEGATAHEGLSISWNDGGGRFHASDASQLPELGSWTFVRAVDLDGDRDLDLVATRPARTTAEVLVLANDGSGRFHDAQGSTPLVTGEADGLVFGRVAVGDVDLDGNLDLVVPVFQSNDGTTSRPNVLLLNDGHGRFSRDAEGRLPAIPPDGDYTLGVSIADFTGDGAPDLYLGEAERRQRLLVNDGAGFFRDESEDDGTGTPRLPRTPSALPRRTSATSTATAISTSRSSTTPP